MDFFSVVRKPKSTSVFILQILAKWGSNYAGPCMLEGPAHVHVLVGLGDFGGIGVATFEWLCFCGGFHSADLIRCSIRPLLAYGGIGGLRANPPIPPRSE